jgi:hypothetical protein
MSDSIEEPDPDDADRPVPLHGQVRHSHLSARVPENVGHGVFSNGVMILTGPFEIVLDFVLRFGEPNRIVARVVLPHVVAQQLVAVLQENLAGFEERFGPVPRIPRLRMPIEEPPIVGGGPEATGEHPANPGHPENIPGPSQPPHIEDIYDELRLPDRMLSGSYANAVMVRHTGTEFCFDFITNIFPRSSVSSRVYLAAPHVPLFLQSLIRSLNPGKG